MAQSDGQTDGQTETMDRIWGDSDGVRRCQVCESPSLVNDAFMVRPGVRCSSKVADDE